MCASVRWCRQLARWVRLLKLMLFKVLYSIRLLDWFVDGGSLLECLEVPIISYQSVFSIGFQKFERLFANNCQHVNTSEM